MDSSGDALLFQKIIKLGLGCSSAVAVMRPSGRVLVYHVRCSEEIDLHHERPRNKVPFLNPKNRRQKLLLILCQEHLHYPSRITKIPTF